MTTDTRANSERRFLWIDLLRGLAAFAVVLHHAKPLLWVGLKPLLRSPGHVGYLSLAFAVPSVPVRFFHAGVMLFFVISGFCIHYPYASKKRALELRSYSVRRFFRIYPPYIGAVILSLGAGWYIGHSPSLREAILSLTMTQNFQNFVNNPTNAQLSSNRALWSLPIELEFYIVYPFFYWLLIRLGRNWAMISAAAISIAGLGVAVGGGAWVLGHFAFYWMIWCSGALLAEWARNNQLPKWRPTYWAIIMSSFGIAMGLEQTRSLEW